MSVFLMGVYDKSIDKFRTVAKCGNGHDDATIARLQKELDMVKISKVGWRAWGVDRLLEFYTVVFSLFAIQDVSKVPKWLLVNKSLLPDFVIRDPKVSHSCSLFLLVCLCFACSLTCMGLFWSFCRQCMYIVHTQKAPVWEITGAEFSSSNIHTADGISIRFPRVTKIRDDKTFSTATDLERLKVRRISMDDFYYAMSYACILCNLTWMRNKSCIIHHVAAFVQNIERNCWWVCVRILYFHMLL